MNLDQVKKFAKEHGYQTVEKLKPWNGYEVYEPIMDEEIAYVGPPLLILVKGNEIRMSTEEEAFQQMDDSEDGTETAKSFSDLLN